MPKKMQNMSEEELDAAHLAAMEARDEARAKCLEIQQEKDRRAADATIGDLNDAQRAALMQRLSVESIASAEKFGGEDN